MTQLERLPDVELVDLLKSNHRVAHDEIFNRYNLILLAEARKRTRDQDEAHDIVQDVFLKLWSKRSRLQIGHNLPGYLYTSVFNAILDRSKHEKVKRRYQTFYTRSAESDSYTIEDALIAKELNNYIEQQIEALPEKRREIFVMSRKLHLSHKEIAERLGITEDTVNKQIGHANKTLKWKLRYYLMISAIGTFFFLN